MTPEQQYDKQRNCRVTLTFLQEVADRLALKIKEDLGFPDMTSGQAIRLFLQVTQRIEDLCQEISIFQEKPIPLGRGDSVEPGTKLYKIIKDYEKEQVT